MSGVSGEVAEDEFRRHLAGRDLLDQLRSAVETQVAGSRVNLAATGEVGDENILLGRLVRVVLHKALAMRLEEDGLAARVDHAEIGGDVEARSSFGVQQSLEVLDGFALAQGRAHD